MFPTFCVFHADEWIQLSVSSGAGSLYNYNPSRHPSLSNGHQGHSFWDLATVESTNNGHIWVVVVLI